MVYCLDCKCITRFWVDFNDVGVYYGLVENRKVKVIFQCSFNMDLVKYEKLVENNVRLILIMSWKTYISPKSLSLSIKSKTKFVEVLFKSSGIRITLLKSNSWASWMWGIYKICICSAISSFSIHSLYKAFSASPILRMCCLSVHNLFSAFLC